MLLVLMSVRWLVHDKQELVDWRLTSNGEIAFMQPCYRRGQLHSQLSADVWANLDVIPTWLG